MPNKIAALILTLNEEINIGDCIKSLSFCDSIFVFDSFSHDKTVSIAEQCGAIINLRKFDNYAAQRNAALKSVPSNFEWILMIDADERVSSELEEEIQQVTANSSDEVSLFRIRRKDYFMNKWIKHSSGYPTWFAKLFRHNQVTVSRDINEEYFTDGLESRLNQHLIHFPFNKGLEWWFDRHNKYSSMEAVSLSDEFKEPVPWGLFLSKDPVKRRKFLKQFIYRMPARPYFIFFIFYIARLGFLDGVAGLRYCKLRKIYETMIDLKIKEIKLRSKGLPN